jgi:hypothetical protein
MMTPIAWLRFISPALTNPTVMTVVADELWTTMVTTHPTITPMIRLLVKAANMPLILDPATFCRAVPIRFIPKRNNPRPPINSIATLIVPP